jgi:hypothetical protein
MSISKLAPWAVTLGALALAVSSWVRPPSPPRAPPMPAHRGAAHASAPAPPRVDEELMAEVVERAVREALVRHERSTPEPDTAVQVAAQEEGLDLVDGLIARGEASDEDRLALRAALGRTDREGADAILSAYFTALNRGDIRVPAGQPPL